MMGTLDTWLKGIGCAYQFPEQKGHFIFVGITGRSPEKSPHWRTLIDYFKDEDCLSEQIHLNCPRHPSDAPVALCNKDASSFDPLVCAKPCWAVLDCGHFCSSTCHHGSHPRCEIQVLFKFQSCGHEEKKQCSQDQETLLCSKEISYTFDACRHTDVLKCWRVTKKEGLFCMHACPKELECGHPCTLKCYEDCKANPCGICIQIKKEIAAKEKQREGREIELKKEELEKEISKLKSQDVTVELSILELDSETDTAAEYLQVRDRTEKFIQPKHDILPVVTKIEKVRCQKSHIKFLETQKDLISPASPTQLLFHGTSDQGIQGILEAGFKLPSEDKRNMFGQRDGKDKGGTLYDEVVVYDPHQAIPRYIVHYKNLAFDPASAMPSLVSPVDRNLTRVLYEMSQTFTGNTPAEYHFRLAESQFFRMSSRNDYKVIKVEHIFNKSLQIQYEKAKEALKREKKCVEEMLVFHGTDKDAIEKIIEEGFKIGGEGVEVRHGSVYGKGVYTALDPNTSISYSKGGMILLSSALIGEKGTDYKEGGSTNVLVLHKTEHLLPKYIVHFIQK
ncbi:hypothetical protein KI387_002298 [Taxus chinensis]|uniref:PARP catalytic domain-containing protein n=1 Tax=Taxus chinensis TaxID=29808 RepID=A0AA38GZA4_TAXCH|nr:hypothetical protein KI387_002298 [Taxus chinensis]